MENVYIKREGTKLIIQVDLERTIGPSKSGKTTVVATTKGNQPIAGLNDETIYLGLNLYKKR